MAGGSNTTTDHKFIRKWVEDRDGWPATVGGTSRGGEQSGLLRIDFPGYSGEQRLKKIGWDEFFRKFDEANLAFLYQEQTRGGKISRFNKFVARTEEAQPKKKIWPLGQQQKAHQNIKGKTTMNIFDLIVHDHENVKTIMQKLLASTTRAGKTREQHFMKLREELLQHMMAEEQLFYPYLMDHADDREPVHEALEEHRSAKIVLSDVEATPVEDESWHPKLKVLHEQIDHHIQEEEADIFELAHEFINEDTANELGQKFQNIKKEARAEKLEMAESRR